MRNIIEDRRVLRMQFEAFAHYARHESGKPESAYCFDALAASVDDVSPELLEAYVEMFQKIEHRKIDCSSKAKMSALSKVEMSVSAPFWEFGGCHFDGHGGDEQARAEPS